MLHKRVKTIWHGEVGIHEKYINSSGGLLLSYVGDQEAYLAQQMFISEEGLAKGRRGKETYRDRSDPTKSYQLIYFKWKDVKFQPSLL